MLKLFLWLRYLRKKKIVLLSIAAVALSVALLIVVASLFTGFIDAFERSAVEVIGDVVVAPPIKLANYPLFIDRLEQISAVEAATATLATPMGCTWICGQRRQNRSLSWSGSPARPAIRLS